MLLHCGRARNRSPSEFRVMFVLLFLSQPQLEGHLDVENWSPALIPSSRTTLHHRTQVTVHQTLGYTNHSSFETAPDLIGQVVRFAVPAWQGCNSCLFARDQIRQDSPTRIRFQHPGLQKPIFPGTIKIIFQNPSDTALTLFCPPTRTTDKRIATNYLLLNAERLVSQLLVSAIPPSSLDEMYATPQPSTHASAIPSTFLLNLASRTALLHIRHPDA
ncbi:hypothetical protein M011DRAFT_46630 [Sporormia fimetaria CBS 119925]|uniref:Uncharacterized protein n=1 Tax=Sporormia fimetaria CBS 119925 TaxID=1340428 RepID=A0A6A6VAE9_9PLEO|nr:hypothetical protein M011DRAFT_46630 [Sporormia fimetaria CBS 119925]